MKNPLYDLFEFIFCSNDFVIFATLCVRLVWLRFYRRRYKSNHLNIGAERERKTPSKGPQSNEICSSHASWNGRLIGMASILLFIASTRKPIQLLCLFAIFLFIAHNLHVAVVHLHHPVQRYQKAKLLLLSRTFAFLIRNNNHNRAISFAISLRCSRSSTLGRRCIVGGGKQIRTVSGDASKLALIAPTPNALQIMPSPT